MKPASACLFAPCFFAAAMALTALPTQAATDILISCGNGSIAQYTSGGTLITQSYITTGLNVPQGIAVDSSGNIWVANNHGNNVTEYNSSGGLINTITLGMSGPFGVTIDNNGNTWVAQSGSSGNDVIEYGPSGNGITGIGGLSAPQGLAVDTSNNLFVANSSSGNIAKINATTQTMTNASYISGLSFPSGLAEDSSGDLWVSNFGANDVLEYNSSGSLIKTLSGVSRPAGLAIDPSTGDLYVMSEPSGTGTVLQYDGSGNLLNGSFLSNANSPTFIAFQSAVASAPEPSIAGLFLVGVAGLAARRRRS